MPGMCRVDCVGTSTWAAKSLILPWWFMYATIMALSNWTQMEALQQHWPLGVGQGKCTSVPRYWWVTTSPVDTKSPRLEKWSKTPPQTSRLASTVKTLQSRERYNFPISSICEKIHQSRAIFILVFIDIGESNDCSLLSHAANTFHWSGLEWNWTKWIISKGGYHLPQNCHETINLSGGFISDLRNEAQVLGVGHLSRGWITLPWTVFSIRPRYSNLWAEIR